MNKCSHENFKSKAYYEREGSFTQEQKDNGEALGIVFKCLDCGSYWSSEMSPEDAVLVDSND